MPRTYNEVIVWTMAEDQAPEVGDQVMIMVDERPTENEPQLYVDAYVDEFGRWFISYGAGIVDDVIGSVIFWANMPEGPKPQ